MQIDAILYNIINLEHDFKSISNDHKCLSTLNLFTLFILVRKSDRVPSEKEEEKKNRQKKTKRLRKKPTSIGEPLNWSELSRKLR